MKRSVLCLLLIYSSNIFANYTIPIRDTSNPVREDFLRKSKGQHTAGLILAGGGLGLVIVGGTIAAKETVETITGTNRNTSGFESATLLILLGAFSMIGAIALLIAARRNKRKARDASIGVKMESFHLPPSYGVAFHQYPAIRLKIRL